MAALTPDRLDSYVAACGGDMERAVRLYTWNAAVSSALWGGFHVVEVTLRNTIHAQLETYVGRADWWNGTTELREFEVRRLSEAIASVRQDKGPLATPGHVVAKLGFGFWTAMLANRYHQLLWAPALQFGFPHLTLQRRDLHRDLERMRRLRNRVAHHEPVFARDLAEDHAKVLSALDAISPAVARWVENDSRLPSVLAARDRVVAGLEPTSL
ncbi:MAG: hypothetical protein FWD59_10965 [Micrococcales bacterium]|nr:hypothetical protein [Micrococcales bacterium]